MSKRRLHLFNHWIDFSYYDGAARIGYGRGDLYVKTLLFWQWKKGEAPSMMLDNLGMRIDEI